MKNAWESSRVIKPCLIIITTLPFHRFYRLHEYMSYDGLYRRPLGSMFHVNQYQDVDWLSGGPSDGDDDIDRTYLGEGHTLFSSNPIVLEFLKMRFEQKVER